MTARAPGRDRPVRQRLGRWLLAAAGLVLAWAAAIALTGGFYLDLGWIRISSRNLERVLFLAALLAAAAWRLAYRDAPRYTVRRISSAIASSDAFLLRHCSAAARGARAAAWAAALAVFLCGTLAGSRVAGGADAFGYVSAALLWRHGALGIDQRALADLPWPDAAATFVPLAYQPGVDGLIGPTVAPGLPLLMALTRVFGACGPYLLIAAAGMALVLATFSLGRGVFGPVAAGLAAVLVATSPVVLFQSLVVMPDVPAAALWTWALACAGRGTTRGTGLAGILAALAILVRPNLVPLAVYPWMLSLVTHRRAPRHAVRETAIYAAATVPAACTIAWINGELFGSPLRSGYGDLSGAFAIEHAWPNILRYVRWWWDSQGAAGFLFVAAVVRSTTGRTREALVLAGFAMTVVLLYVFYLPFEEWWYLRFLMPALPCAFLFGAAAIRATGRDRPSVQAGLAVCLLVVGVAHAAGFIASKDILTNSDAERRRYLDAAVYVDRAIPPDAVVLAMQHSGSVRYYTGRLTLRWDRLANDWLDRAVEALHARGRPVYALLEGWEEDELRTRFSGQRALAAMASPLAATPDRGIRLYAMQGSSRAPAAVIPRYEAGGCVDASPRFRQPPR